MAGQKTISASFFAQPIPPPPPPVADYHVTGTITPDATGDYFVDGVYNGFPCYRNATSTFWIWYLPGTPAWVICAIKGNIFIPGWVGAEDQIETSYEPGNGAIGIATVSAVP